MNMTLQGATILITRPREQAHMLIQAIEARGGHALLFPTLEIADAPNLQSAAAHFQALPKYRFVIFSSANAVTKSRSYWPKPWPATTQAVAIGPATAQALQQAGIQHVLLAPEPYNSEALLEHPALAQVFGQSILICTGLGGRNLLQERLQARGAKLDTAIVYQRRRPEMDTRALVPAWQASSVNAIITTSNESLQNLYDLVAPPQRNWLLTLPLIVISPRGAALARELGFQKPALIAQAATETAILQALETWYHQASIFK